MRRAGFALSLAVLAALGAFLAGLVAGAPLALAGGSAPTGTDTTTTVTTGTTTGPKVIASGVRIAGVRVGGLTADQARFAVVEVFNRPLFILVAHRRLVVTAQHLGTRARIADAVNRALRAARGTKVRLVVVANRPKVRAYAAAIAKRFDLEPFDSVLSLRNLRPWLTKERSGRRLRQRWATNSILEALFANRRKPVPLSMRELPPRVTRASYGPVVVIHRGSNRLYLYNGMRLWRSFGVATGQSSYPTPVGRWRVVVKWRNPWWYPPPSPWAQGSKPIPPGPGNPLGTRWMGLSASGVGIHGTPDDASIGYSASHGCIRMHIPDAEWLFTHLRIGTTVFIVAA
ncbi:MAG: L,D-transpeptidase/peptidoglycan binding protein [Actinomycetota bacterium]|nr:L,D-transpeptidase/peptidoglycan binding protein [Actinomycetota bacterium]